LFSGPDEDIMDLDIGRSLDDVENTVSNVFGLDMNKKKGLKVTQSLKGTFTNDVTHLGFGCVWGGES
jgi:hypothetical protein